MSVCVRVLWTDCPQVQCIEQYVAQQADELTLEPTEIVNVIRKTNEGKRSRDHRQTGATLFKTETSTALKISGVGGRC